MVAEVLRSIKHAEEAADKKVKEARVEGEKLIEKAKAVKIVEQARANAQKRVADIIAKAEEEGKREGDRIIKKGVEEESKVKESAEKKIAAASMAIVKNIVEV